jgi:hypothetical protein
MTWRWTHIVAMVASAGVWIALWYSVGAILYWLFWR